MTTKRLATTSDITPALADNRANRKALIEWANYATFQAKCGNRDETLSALEQVALYAQAVSGTSQLTEDLLSGLKAYSETVESQLDQTISERDELERAMQHDVLDMAMQIAAVDRASDDSQERTRVESMAERMRDDGTPDFVLDEERKTTEYLARKAWQMAQQETVEQDEVA